MNKIKKSMIIFLTGLAPVFFLAGCSGSTLPAASESTTESVTFTVVGQDSSELLNDEGVHYSVPHIIKQGETVFGENGCSGAAGLMALQAAGCLMEADTDEEYKRFWDSVPQNADATKGFNGNGIWNPAYAEWLASFTEAKRIEDFTAADLKSYIDDGYVVVVLVSLGETGNTTHWMSVTGYKISDGLMLYDVADPWSGVLHEYTAARLQKRLEEGAKRKGDFGAGYGTDGVIISVNAAEIGMLL